MSTKKENEETLLEMVKRNGNYKKETIEVDDMANEGGEFTMEREQINLNPTNKTLDKRQFFSTCKDIAKEIGDIDYLLFYEETGPLDLLKYTFNPILKKSVNSVYYAVSDYETPKNAMKQSELLMCFPLKIHKSNKAILDQAFTVFYEAGLAMVKPNMDFREMKYCIVDMNGYPIVPYETLQLIADMHRKNHMETL